MSEWHGDVNHPDDAYRYEIHNGTRASVLPRASWQMREYVRLMGSKPPNGLDPQYQYNPRTKAGKALLEEMMNGGPSNKAL